MGAVRAFWSLVASEFVGLIDNDKKVRLGILKYQTLSLNRCLKLRCEIFSFQLRSLDAACD